MCRESGEGAKEGKLEIVENLCFNSRNPKHILNFAGFTRTVKNFQCLQKREKVSVNHKSMTYASYDHSIQK